ncbi:MAG TPA: GAP family protein [Solirubrobacteraceae bacterium]|jgi:hypothetical protein
MGEAIGQVLTLGIGVALSPLPIIAVVLMLGTPRARSNSLAFLCGWLLGLAVVGALVLVISGSADASSKGAPATWVDVLKLVLGALLLGFALRTWHRRPTGEGDEAALPGWMQAIDSFTAPRALGLAALLSGVNPKNLMMTLGAATAIAQTGIGAGGQAGALAVFIAIGTLGPGLPVVLYFALGERAEQLLSSLKGWMAANNTTIMAVLCLLIATKLLGDGISGLST